MSKNLIRKLEKHKNLCFSNKNSVFKTTDESLWENVKKTIKPLHDQNTVPSQQEIFSLKDKELFIKSFGQRDEKYISLTPSMDKIAKKPSLLGGKVSSQKTCFEESATINFKQRCDGKAQYKHNSVEASLDLHCCTAHEAYISLERFLQCAYIQEWRYVLVITGKGHSKGSTALLKRSVPHWLSSPKFQKWVRSFQGASVCHGGDGALYVQICRKT